MNITKKEFMAYESVRRSGVTNMLDVSTVELCSGLSRDKTCHIIENYNELHKKYLEDG